MNGERTDLQSAVLETSWGRITIKANPRGVVSCVLPRPSRRAARGAWRLRSIRLSSRPAPALRQAAKFVAGVLAGRKPARCPILDETVLSAAPPFRRAAWRALAGIPRGRTISYAELARRAGNPRAARAAGRACGANPLPVFIPCHRVVAATGGLGGFSGGLAWKARLLALEGARP